MINNDKELADNVFLVLTSPPASERLEQADRDMGLLNEVDSSLLEAVPGLNSVIGGLKTILNVQRRFLLKKIIRFFSGVHEISLEERMRFHHQFESEPEFRARVSEALIILLDRYDHLDKSELLALVYAGWVRGEIDEEIYWRLGLEIDRCYIEDLRALFRFFSENKSSDPSWERLFTCGLATFITEMPDRNGKGRSFLVGPPIMGASQDAVLLSKLVLGSAFVMPDSIHVSIS